ncbi:hypothetical protein F1D05_31025 [Kribbella qitaiheensis]|uniref:Big-1 domain-containing protein n=1 Tax=Kribbella qitaiheensis TaxID=1544730 RepID=A0A7G6X5N2_9ACTN|nr:Ig-like domain-containing protein [Kribbella qitaiheensis]QNE21547.1 hypothetical protein F1D05_31025 [Kribbella qitaiheensis]
MRRALLLLTVAFLVVLPAWPSPAANADTEWACTGGSVETCIKQSTDHGYSTDSVTITAQFRDDDEVIDATSLTIFVNDSEKATVSEAGEVSLTYKLDPGRALPATDEIYAVGDDVGYPFQSPTIEHLWVKRPVLTVAASPNGTSGEVGSSFTVQAHLTLDSKPLRNTAVKLTSSMSGQPQISRTATSDVNGSVSFTYTRQTAGEDEIVVTASWQGQSGAASLIRRWRLSPPTPPSTPPTSPTSPTLTPTSPVSSQPPSDPTGPSDSSTPSTPSDSPTPLRASLDLSPNNTSTAVGRDFTVTAAVTTRSGDPVPDRLVTFESTKRGEGAISRTATTDDEGKAQFTYRRNTAGSDAVHARVSVDGTGLSERIVHAWTDRATPPSAAGTLRLDSDVVNPGSDLKLTGSGCPANGRIELSIGDFALAGTRADSAGDYRVVAPLPELPLGRHKVKASCAGSSTTATVDVVGVTAAMGTAGAAGVTTVAVLAFFVLLGGSIVRGLGNLGVELPFR